MRKFILVLTISLIAAGNASSQTDEILLMRKANPLCYISFPFQHNFDFNIPPNNGTRWTMNLMPIFPARLSRSIELITRVVLPVISQSHIYGTTTQTGVGDLLINTFISPRLGKVVWGIGPSFYFPSGMLPELSAKKWATGPGVIAVIQTRKVMAGALLFHLWSFAGDEKRPDFSYSYFQPIVVYSIKHGWGLGLTSEIGLEWKRRITTGAIVFTGQKAVKIGQQIVNFVLGPKLFFGNFNAPQFGFRASVNLLFP
ncbi:MAG: hypothetical protein IH596_05225 [Bacteroidales bacterium]|nr:hypothetical protein [Bacteroidales bacterium]